jgi:hypothetical protein
LVPAEEDHLFEALAHILDERHLVRPRSLGVQSYDAEAPACHAGLDFDRRAVSGRARDRR